MTVGSATAAAKKTTGSETVVKATPTGTTASAPPYCQFKLHTPACAANTGLPTHWGTVGGNSQ